MFAVCFKLLLISFTDLGIDIQDDMGRHEVGYVEDVTKTPIKSDGKTVTGCNFRAAFRINKVCDRSV